MTIDSSPGPIAPGILSLMRCPRCGSTLSAGAVDAVECRQGHAVPIVNGIPRFVSTPHEDMAKRTQASFGYEWSHFNNWRDSGEANFNDYFQQIDLAALAGRTVLDAGCGMGRHTRQLAAFAGRVVAVDFSRAIDEAARNTSSLPNVICIQADLLALPFADRTFDFIYSLGVLHHLADTDRALAGLVTKLKPGGRARIYLYWKRRGWPGRMLKAVALARRATTRLPFPLLRLLCWILSVALFGLVIVPYRMLSRLGVRMHDAWPLATYSKYPFAVLYNDQFDRFSAPIEKRYDAEDVRLLLRRAGLTDVLVHPSFGWLADGTRPA